MRKVWNCAIADIICVVKLYSSGVHMHNFESISVAKEIMHL